MTKSASQTIYEYLQTKEVGYVFTCQDFPELEGVTYGALTGMLHKAVKKGMIEALGKRKHESTGRSLLHYELINPQAEWLHKHKTPGRAPGVPNRGYHPTPYRETEKESASTLASRLFELAVEVEKLEASCDLSRFSTHELLEELEKRIG